MNAVEFWDQLDFIGMTTYYTLADKANPTVDEIVDKWEPYKKKILDWQKKYNKPLLFTRGWLVQPGRHRQEPVELLPESKGHAGRP